MDLRESFLAMCEAAKRAPKNVPTAHLAWWAEFGALMMVHADAVADAVKEINRLKEAQRG